MQYALEQFIDEAIQLELNAAGTNILDFSVKGLKQYMCQFLHTATP